MNYFLKNLEILVNEFATNYNVNLGTFFVIYVVSFIPFYLGYLLIVYGTTRQLKFRDILTLKFKGNLQWDKTATLGFYIHLFGRLMPYAYILFFGKNLALWVYGVVIIVALFSVYVLFRKVATFQERKRSQDVNVVRLNQVIEPTEKERLWSIYDKVFEPVNKISPCKQSLDKVHFFAALEDVSIRKYILKYKDDKIIGLTLTTNNFSNTPWISEEYFEENYKKYHKNRMVYYFMGLAIDSNYRGNKYSISLIESVIDDLPDGAIMGFDHSRNVNPMLHQFTRVVRQSKVIERKHIDKQHYHVVEKK